MQVGQRLHGVFVVAVGNDIARARHKTRKLPEGAFHRLQILEVVQMIRFNVVDDRNGGIEIQKGIAVFAAFHDDGIAVADAVPGLQQRQIAAQHDGRIAMRLHKNVGNHGGRGRLAVRAGNADRVFIFTHDQAPRLRALKNGNALRARGSDLRIVVVCRSGADDAVRALDILRAMPDVHSDSLCDQFIRGNRGIHVRPGDDHSLVPQNQAKRPHGNAADADQMDVLSRQQIFIQPFTDVCHVHSSNTIV